MPPAVQITIVARNALAFLSEYAAPLVPATQPMRDRPLIPESAGRLDGRNFGNGKVKSIDFVRDVRGDHSRLVGIERRFSPRLDAHHRADIGAIPWFDFEVMDEQSLVIAVGFIDFDSPYPDVTSATRMASESRSGPVM
jgi:hypothetical protein